MDLNKTALKIPVPGTSALAFGSTIAAGTVPQRRLTDGSPFDQGSFIPYTTQTRRSPRLRGRNTEREAGGLGGDAYKTRLDEI